MVTFNKKIILIGFPKAGTSSFHKSFTSAGIPSYHQFLYKKSNVIGKILLDNFSNNANILKGFPEQSFALTEINFTSIGQSFWPQLNYDLLQQLLEEDKSVHFILNYRDPTKLINSMKRWHNNFHYRLIKNDIPGLPCGKGKTDSELQDWVRNHYELVRNKFSKSDRYIELNIEDNLVREKLSKFLKIPINWWGVENKNYEKN